ncbi:hypothetical protein NL676_035511 [Syzygium grande]|nr:hypothetical protein NL676_035511 [Syzygium grande]
MKLGNVPSFPPDHDRELRLVVERQQGGGGGGAPSHGNIAHTRIVGVKRSTQTKQPIQEDEGRRREREGGRGRVYGYLGNGVAEFLGVGGVAAADGDDFGAGLEQLLESDRCNRPCEEAAAATGKKSLLNKYKCEELDF